MSLETFQYLDSLVPSNPSVTDGIVQGDDHIRGIKLTLKQTFPNITGPLTASQADLNAVAGGASFLADAGAFFKTNTTDGFVNSLAGDIDVKLQGQTAATFQRTGGANFLKNHGQFISDGEIKGPGITPIGGTIIWWDDLLPSDGLWVWANGQIIANANTVCPILLARWGSRFGGNGTTTMGVPDMQEVVPVGKSGMGGATTIQGGAAGVLTSIASSIKGVLSSLFGADTVTLSTTQMPVHYHTASIYDPGHQHGTPLNYAIGVGGAGFQAYTALASANAGVGSGTFPSTAQATNVRINSSNGLDSTYSAGGGAAHTNLQPSKVVNWIIRLG